MIQLNKALFLDLDGTIVKTKSGDVFCRDVNDWEFITGVLPAIKRYVEKGYIPIIVANEGGIELGHVTQANVELKMNLIRKEIEAYIRTDVNVAYCPSMDHYDRKPNPGMAFYFAIALHLDLRQCIMIGDTTSDTEFATMAGIGGYLHISQFADRLV
jgi:histidinol-phosphate phosphatase family protein